MKRNLFKKNIFLLFTLLLSIAGFCQKIQLSNNSKISILTCGLGNESYSYFGHTTIRIQDESLQMDQVYNYGTFDFSTPNFVARFAKGDLQYYVTSYPFSNFIEEYNYEKRSVFEQELELATPTKQKILDHLNETLESDSRFYTYKFIDKNCTSMVVAVLNEALGENIITKKTNTIVPYRSVLYPYFEEHFFQKLGVNLIFGTKVDKPATQLFLPMELLESIKQTSYKGNLISKPIKTILFFEKENLFSWWNSIYLYCFILAMIVINRRKIISFSYLFLMGLLGIFFAYMGWYSLHQELAFNYSLFLCNPSLLLLLFFIAQKKQKLIKTLIYFNWLCLFVYLLILVNKAHFLIVLPLVLTNSLLLLDLYSKNNKLLLQSKEGNTCIS